MLKSNVIRVIFILFVIMWAKCELENKRIIGLYANE